MEGKRIQIAVVGASACSDQVRELAVGAGREIARRGAVLLCGGLGGVMEAAAQGAREEGGLTVGVLPGARADEANPYVDLRIVTNMGHARNVVLVTSADGVLAVSGGYGTLSEIAVALKLGRPCVGVRSWTLDGRVASWEVPEEAVRDLCTRIRGRGAV